MTTSNSVRVTTGIKRINETVNLKPWQRLGIERFYISQDTLADLVNLTVTRYNTGSISGAAIGGKGISNNMAARILNAGFWLTDNGEEGTTLHTRWDEHSSVVSFMESVLAPSLDKLNQEQSDDILEIQDDEPIDS